MLRDEMVRTGGRIWSDYLEVYPTHKIRTYAKGKTAWIVGIRECPYQTMLNFLVRYESDGTLGYMTGSNIEVLEVNMVLRQKVRAKGDEWYQMEEFVMSVEVNKQLPKEISFHTRYPLDLAEAFEKHSGLPVTYCNAVGMLEIRL